MAGPWQRAGNETFKPQTLYGGLIVSQVIYLPKAAVSCLYLFYQIRAASAPRSPVLCGFRDMRGHGSVPAARLRPNPNIPIARCGYHVTNQKIQAVGRSLAVTRSSSLHDRNKHSHFMGLVRAARGWIDRHCCLCTRQHLTLMRAGSFRETTKLFASACTRAQLTDLVAGC